jgi:hypothetical protein
MKCYAVPNGDTFAEFEITSKQINIAQEAGYMVIWVDDELPKACDADFALEDDEDEDDDE